MCHANSHRSSLHNVLIRSQEIHSDGVVVYDSAAQQLTFNVAHAPWVCNYRVKAFCPIMILQVTIICVPLE